MKKRLIGLLILLMGIPFLVSAASIPYRWIVGEEELSVPGQSNTAGTATIEKDEKIVTLKLKNYNGGSLKLECYGSGQADAKFVIELEGENTITADDIGIDMGEESSKKLEFQGNGTLKITASKPISNEEYQSEAFFDPSGFTKEESIEATEQEQEEQEDLLIAEKDEEEDALIAEEDVVTTGEEKDNTKIIIIFLGVVIVGCIGAIALIKHHGEEKPQ